MTHATPKSIHLARQILALESSCAGEFQQPGQPPAQQPASRPAPQPAPQVVACAKLAATLTVYTGAAGVRLLMMRALALAKAEAPSLSNLEILENSTVAGFESAGNSHADSEADDHILIAHLLDLLTTFIGDRLMRGVVREVWPETSSTPTPPSTPPAEPRSPRTSRAPRSRAAGSKNKDKS